MAPSSIFPSSCFVKSITTIIIILFAGEQNMPAMGDLASDTPLRPSRSRSGATTWRQWRTDVSGRNNGVVLLICCVWDCGLPRSGPLLSCSCSCCLTNAILTQFISWHSRISKIRKEASCFWINKNNLQSSFKYLVLMLHYWLKKILDKHFR